MCIYVLMYCGVFGCVNSYGTLKKRKKNRSYVGEMVRRTKEVKRRKGKGTNRHLEKATEIRIVIKRREETRRDYRLTKNENKSKKREEK